jgi:hypothetical protein
MLNVLLDNTTARFPRNVALIFEGAGHPKELR